MPLVQGVDRRQPLPRLLRQNEAAADQQEIAQIGDAPDPKTVYAAVGSEKGLGGDVTGRLGVM